MAPALRPRFGGSTRHTSPSDVIPYFEKLGKIVMLVGFCMARLLTGKPSVSNYFCITGKTGRQKLLELNYQMVTYKLFPPLVIHINAVIQLAKFLLNY